MSGEIFYDTVVEYLPKIKVDGCRNSPNSMGIPMLLGEFPSEVGDDNGNSPNYMGIPKWGWW
jgi:hypothetical protein